MTKVTIIPDKNKTSITLELLEAPASIGKLLEVVHPDQTMVGLVVKETEGTNAFLPLFLNKNGTKSTTDIPFDSWPLENLFYCGGIVNYFNGKVTLG